MIHFQKVMSGDVITNTNAAFQRAKKKLMATTKNNEGLSEEDLGKLLGIGVNPPEPVFFCSIEPPSSGYQTALEHALSELQREDPSLRVTHNPETGQTVLGGTYDFF